MRKKEVWVDNVKVFACILVVLGHFFQSMVKTNIMPDNNLYQWFNQTIYYFHVPLFFICSGYLYQRYSRVLNVNSWKNNILKKALNLGIPYFLFSIITLVLKNLFKDSVNATNVGFIKTLFFYPTSPYWYLYVLFFVFLVTPTFKSKHKLISIFAVALIMKFLNIIGIGEHNLPYAINGILNYEIWFVSGICMSMFEWEKNIKAQVSLIGVLFVVLSIYVYAFNITFKGMSFLLGIMACISVISIVYCAFKENKQNRVLGILAKYNLPIYVMHTIFAAGFRGMLVKFGVTNMMVHVLIGIIVSFVGPITAAWVMEKIRFLNFFLYPSRCIDISE